jgi:GNAT superfamily N-acetyltransferase
MKMDYQLIKVGSDKVDEVHQILSVCGLDMKARFSLEHWIPPYPLHLLQRDIGEKSVYLVRGSDQTLATFTIGTDPEGYGDVSVWRFPMDKAVYVNHLAVRPEFQGKGIGTWCMMQCEKIAKEMHCSAVRLDAVEKHVALINYYEKLGYQRRGIIGFRDDVLVCFEKCFQ